MGILGNFVHSVSPGAHKALVKTVRREFEIAPPRWIYAEPHIHAFLREFFAGTTGTFIEAGANNGLHRSNTIYLENALGWQGYLIEAIPHLFVECRRNRPNSTCIHCGLVPPEYEEQSVPLVFMNSMSMVDSDENFLDMEEHRRKYDTVRARIDPLDGTKFMAPARTLTDVMGEHGFPEITFMSLDVEGFELGVLRGTDFDRVRPRYILIEDWDESGINTLLEDKGYRVKKRLGSKDVFYESVS